MKRVGADSFMVKGWVKGDLFGAVNAAGPWLSREEPYMRYRGRTIKRTKFFLTASRDLVGVYGYTGFQHESVLHYGCYKEVAVVEELVDRLNGEFGSGFNHVIGTRYEDGRDQIGFHSDKTYSWVANSSVAIVSLGATREFHMKRISDGAVEVFEFEDGDLFMLGWEDNKTYQHSIPEMENEAEALAKGARISLCFRNIATAYTRAEIAKHVVQAAKSRVVREVKKVEKKRKAEALVDEELINEV